MVRIATSQTSLNALRQLGDATRAYERSVERLSSGMRINGPADDAAGLSVASSLQVDRRLFSTAIRNVNDGISLLNLADSALRELGGIGARVSELAAQAASESYSTTQRRALHLEAEAFVKEYNRVIKTTSFNGLGLLDGSINNFSIQGGPTHAEVLTLGVGHYLGPRAGTGDFAGSWTLNAATEVHSVKVADLNGDGHADLVMGLYGISGGTSRIRIAMGNGDGTFGAIKTHWLGAAGHVYDIVLEDFNNDGHLDIFANGSYGAGQATLLNNGQGSFSTSFTAYVGSYYLTTPQVVMDFNGDGKLDVAIAQQDSNKLSILLGNGNGTFAAPKSLSYPDGGLSGLQSVVGGDFDGDGVPDLVIMTRSDALGSATRVLKGNGDGTFTEVASRAGWTGVLGTADLNGDGRLDFFGTSFAGIQRADGTIMFQDMFSGVSGTEWAVDDLNGDGHPDIVQADFNGAGLKVLINNGDGTFKPATNVTGAVHSHRVQVGDVNGDGIPDLVGKQAGSIGIYIGNGDGTFRRQSSFAVGGASAALTFLLEDLNGDGILDIASPNRDANTLTVHLGVADPVRRVTVLDPGDFSLRTRLEALSTLEHMSEIRSRITLERGSIGSQLSRLEVTSRVLASRRDEYAAAESRITDIDVAAEAAQLVRQRILQQTAAAILGQATLQPKLALDLLL